MLLTSANLAAIGVPHAFTTRQGGVSAAPFDSLNFGNPGELPPGVARDPKSNIARNFHLVLDELGCHSRSIEQVHQVHGAAVHLVRQGTPIAVPLYWGDVKADAAVTDDPARVVAVRVADCCPVLLASSDGRVVAAVHAGWRGVIAGAAAAAIAEMRALGAADIIAAIGPCISAAHFEVGPEVLSEFRRVFGESAPISRESRSTGKGHIDLQSALALQLRSSGVAHTQVLPGCTITDRSRYFSHRRDRGATGRMIGIIGPRT